MLRDRTPYRDPATDHEALLVQRNAPRWLRKLHQFDILVHNPDGACSVHWPSVPNRSHRPDSLTEPGRALPSRAPFGVEATWGSLTRQPSPRYRAAPVSNAAILVTPFPSRQDPCLPQPGKFRGNARAGAVPPHPAR